MIKPYLTPLYVYRLPIFAAVQNCSFTCFSSVKCYPGSNLPISSNAQHPGIRIPKMCGLLGLMLAFLFVSYSVNAQVAEITFYTKKDGLAHNAVINIRQLEDGYLWIGNDSRSFRFDGENFVEYPKLNDLIPREDQLVSSLSYEDTLLAFSTFESLYLINPKTGETETFLVPDEGEKGLQLVFVDQVQSDVLVFYYHSHPDSLRSTIWIFQDRHFRFVPLDYAKYDGAPIRLIPIEEDLFLFSTTNGELSVLNEKWELMSSTQFSYNGRERFYMNGMEKDTSGKILLLGYMDKLILEWSNYHVSPTPHPISRFLDPIGLQIRDFYLEENGDIWVCGSSNCLAYYNAEQDTLYQFQKDIIEITNSDITLSEIIKDNTGLFWVSSDLGLLKVRPQINPIQNFLTEPTENNIYYSFRGMAEDDDGKIYASSYNGIILFDPETGESQVTDIPFILPFQLLLEGSHLILNNGSVWNTQHHLWKPIEGAVLNLQDWGVFTKDSSGRIWWSVRDRLSWLNKDGVDWRWEEAAVLPMHWSSGTDALHFGIKSQFVWIGFKDRLLAYNPKTDSLIPYSNYLLEHRVERIMAIEELEDGTLWLATANGLLRFDPESKSTRLYQVKDGLPDNYICGMLMEGDSCFWLSTNNGISRFHIEAGSFINFFKIDGLPDNEFNRASYFKASDGRMFFGGMRGITSFYPEELMNAYQNKSNSIRWLLTAFERSNSKTDSVYRRIQFPDDPELHVYPYNPSFSLEFAVSDYVNPEDIAYSYKLDGYESAWSLPTTLNSVRFSKVPPGTYTFRVRAREGSGIWYQSQMAVQLIVHPHWYETWWARISYILLATFGVLGYIRWRTRSIKARNRVLEQTVSERTHELEEQILRAEQSEQFKEQFLANMSHEIRTPMNAILGMARILIRNKHLPTQKKYLEAIQQSSGNLLVILNDILDLSKIEAGKIEIQHIPIHLEEVVDAVLDLLRFKAEGKGIALTSTISEEFQLAVYGDATRLIQVLTNLVGNAIKFTDSGSVELRLSKTNDQLHFEVRDTGIGIPEDQISRIFESFQQVHTTDPHKYGGTGLGLAITRQLVQLQGGRMKVESQVGEGSTFHVFLPYQPVMEEVVEAAKMKESQIQEMAQSLKGLRILLADDNEFNLMLANDDLQYYIPDVVVKTVTNGAMAAQSLEKEAFDLVLMDVHMPVLDGLQATQLIRKQELLKHINSGIPIIAMTASLLKKEIRACLDAGMNDYIPKPYTMEELIPTIYKNWQKSTKD